MDEPGAAPSATTGPAPESTPTTIDRLGARVLAASPWKVLAAGALLRAVTTGVWTTPNIQQWLRFADDPFGPADIDPAGAYITGSPVGPVLAHVIGAEGELAFAVLHLALLGASCAALVTIGRATVGDRLTNVCLIALLASPLSNVLLTWLGQPDAVMLGGLSALGFASAIRQPWARGIITASAGIVIGLASFEQGVLAVALLALLVWRSDERADREVLAGALLGLAAGRGLVAAFLAASDAPYLSRSAWARSLGLEPFVRGFLYNLPALVFSLFGPGWLLIGRAVAVLRPVATAVSRAATLVLILALASAVLALDETRVTTLVLWPSTVWLLRRVDRAAPRALDDRLIGFVALAAVAVPAVVIWEGSPYISSWRIISHRFL